MVFPEGVQLKKGGDVQGRPGGKEDGGSEEELPRAGQVVFKQQAHWRLKISAIWKEMSVIFVISLDKKLGGGNFYRKGKTAG